MTVCRRIISIVLMLSGLAAIFTAGWVGLNSSLPEPALSFEDADEIHKSVYADSSISKLLEQNLRMQEAVFAGQKQGFQKIVQNAYEVQVSSHRIFMSVFILLAFSIFCQVAAFMVWPRAVKIHNRSLSQLETMMWEGWVADKKNGSSDEFTVQESAYPVSLCGCSDSGVPVHLCGCSSSAYPVSLCGCSSGYLDGCKKVPPAHLCGCEKK